MREMTNVVPFPDAENYRDEAVSWLDEQIADGRAGLDPYDETVFIVVTRDQLRALDVIQKTGWLLSVSRNGMLGQPVFRVRARLAPDVRKRLGLDDKPTAPVMSDEPLASRRA